MIAPTNMDYQENSMNSSKGYKGIGMDGFIARSYNKSAKRFMDLYREWAQRLAPQIRDGSKVLEVAPGPGYLAIELAKRTKCRICALEISETFVSIARDNAQQAGVEIDIRLGNASAMPFEDEEFDFLICTSSFKNFSEPVIAIEEMYRVLKSGGKAWISDLRRDVSKQAIKEFVGHAMKVKGFAGIFMRYTFTHTLRSRAYTGAQFRQLVEKTAFEKTEIRENAMDFEALLQK